MAIPASLVKQLRDETGAPMMDCKKALIETDGDMEAAKQALRRRGAAVAEKRAGKAASAGVIAASASADRKSGVLVELLCETDFVARNPDFQNLASQIAAAVLNAPDAAVDKERVAALPLEGGSVADHISDSVSKIGERIELGRILKKSGDGAVVDTYIHHDKSKGVLIEMAGSGDKLADLAHSIAVHIAWGDPEYISSDEVDPKRLDEEMETERQRAIEEGKPPQAAEQIAKGRVHKNFLARVCLLEQPFMGQKETVADIIKHAEADSPGAKIVSFTRFAVGA